MHENLRLGAVNRRARAGWRGALDEVHAIFPKLLERRHQAAATLSGGEQQMLAIGRGLMARPTLMLLDEPTLGLAPAMALQMFELIRTLSPRRSRCWSPSRTCNARSTWPPRLRDRKRPRRARGRRRRAGARIRRSARPTWDYDGHPLHRVPGTPPLALDVAGDGSGELVALHARHRRQPQQLARQLPAFAEHFSCVAWDARGYGDSDDYEGALAFDDFVD